jgi:adenine-specific DNA-methyltransferase
METEQIVATQPQQTNLALRKLGDATRLHASSQLHENHRSAFGQYLTPGNIAAFMASLIQLRRHHIRVLDPGAGTGSLSLAITEHFTNRKAPPRSLHIVCYEIEQTFLPFLEENLQRCATQCATCGTTFTFEIRHQDFLEAAANLLDCAVFGLPPQEQFDVAILNPPYKKIAANSRERHMLRAISLETVNLYAGFLAASASLVADDGELVAITPRSFCNGPYYRNFRRYLLDRMTLKRLHVFDTRDTAFKDDKVLQETVITHAKKSTTRGTVQITSNARPEDPIKSSLSLPHDSVVLPEDHEVFIRLVASREELRISEQVSAFTHTLSEIGLEVSTGRVVDFRSREYLMKHPAANGVPLIYPLHFRDWGIAWPNVEGKKPNAIRSCETTASMLLPPERFVLTKRFSTKEEKRRVVAVVYDPKEVSDSPVAFENHINYYHASNRGIEENLAWGLAAYLNSSLLDSYFRTFNGHTQVNATDLRSLPYPSIPQLERLGRYAKAHKPGAHAIDDYLLTEIGEA